MDTMKKLPDAEFDIMKVVWANEPPITTNIIMEQLGNGRGWKAQTVISLMLPACGQGLSEHGEAGKGAHLLPPGEQRGIPEV